MFVLRRVIQDGLRISFLLETLNDTVEILFSEEDAKSQFYNLTFTFHFPIL